MTDDLVQELLDIRATVKRIVSSAAQLGVELDEDDLLKIFPLLNAPRVLASVKQDRIDKFKADSRSFKTEFVEMRLQSLDLETTHNPEGFDLWQCPHIDVSKHTKEVLVQRASILEIAIKSSWTKFNISKSIMDVLWTEALSEFNQSLLDS